jgi:hypothetical protein
MKLEVNNTSPFAPIFSIDVQYLNHWQSLKKNNVLKGKIIPVIGL